MNWVISSPKRLCTRVYSRYFSPATKKTVLSWLPTELDRFLTVAICNNWCNLQHPNRRIDRCPNRRYISELFSCQKYYLGSSAFESPPILGEYRFWGNTECFGASPLATNLSNLDLLGGSPRLANRPMCGAGSASVKATRQPKPENRISGRSRNTSLSGRLPMDTTCRKTNARSIRR